MRSDLRTLSTQLREQLDALAPIAKGDSAAAASVAQVVDELARIAAALERQPSPKLYTFERDNRGLLVSVLMTPITPGKA